MNSLFAQLGQLRSEIFTPVFSRSKQGDETLISAVSDAAKSAPAYLTRDLLSLREDMVKLFELGRSIRSDPSIQKRVCGVYSKFLTCDHLSESVVNSVIQGKLSQEIASRFVNELVRRAQRADAQYQFPETFKQLAHLLWEIRNGVHGKRLQDLLSEADPCLMMPQTVIPLLIIQAAVRKSKAPDCLTEVKDLPEIDAKSMSDSLLRVIRNALDDKPDETDVQFVSALRKCYKEIQLMPTQLGQIFQDLSPILQSDTEALRKLAENFICWSDGVSASEVTSLIEDDEVRSELFDRQVIGMSVPIFVLLKEVKFDEARQLVSELPQSGARSRLEALIEELDYYQRLEPESALSLLEGLPTQFVEAMNTVSQELDGRSRQRREEKKIDEAIELALIEPSVFLRDPQLANLVEDLVGLGQFDRAEELLSAIQGEEWRDEMVEKIDRYNPK